MTKPKLYFALFNPGARACMITAKLIGLDMDLQFVDFANNDHLTEEFQNLKANNQIPVLLDSDGTVYIGSFNILCHMASKYTSDDRLYPKESAKRARVEHRMHYENTALYDILKDIVLRNVHGGEYELNPKIYEASYNAYRFLERYLARGQYVEGNEMTIADIAINTTLITLDFFIPVDAACFPKVRAWMERMKTLPDYEEVNVKGARALYKRISSAMAIYRGDGSLQPDVLSKNLHDMKQHGHSEERSFTHEL